MSRLNETLITVSGLAYNLYSNTLSSKVNPFQAFGKARYNKFMSLFQTALLILAVSAVAIADVLLRKAEALGGLTKAILSPWMLGAVALYLFQIFFFTYLFVSGAKLINVGVIQTVFYALIVILSGVFIFGESLSSVQIIGMILALSGVFLLNL